MLKLEWSNKLSLGIPIIDSQHQAIFKAINMLLKSFNEGNEADSTFEILAFIEEYVKKHFTTEEFYLRKFVYEDYDNHVELHRDFTKKLEDFKARHRKGGLTKLAAIEMQAFLLEWWVLHIEKTDSKYAGLFRANIKNIEL